MVARSKPKSATIHIEDLEGRDHWVVPTVMITEGVFNGSRGPVLYPADELRKSVSAWNGKPVVVYHPDMSISNGFASSPQVFKRQKVGVLFNASFDGQRLLADAWIDCGRCRQVDKRVSDAIESKTMMEVSTGLSFPLQTVEGVHNGKSYALVAKDLQPDHLAILPDKVGACSIKDGAGLVRNDRLEMMLMLPAWKW